MSRDRINITNKEKKLHYLLHFYKSGVFPHTVVREWKLTPKAHQTYANAKTFFRREEKSMRDIKRITGNSAGSTRYKVAASLIGKGLEDILAKINRTVHQGIR